MMKSSQRVVSRPICHRFVKFGHSRALLVRAESSENVYPFLRSSSTPIDYSLTRFAFFCIACAFYRGFMSTAGSQGQGQEAGPTKGQHGGVVLMWLRIILAQIWLHAIFFLCSECYFYYLWCFFFFVRARAPDAEFCRHVAEWRHMDPKHAHQSENENTKSDAPKWNKIRKVKFLLKAGQRHCSVSIFFPMY